MCQVAYLKLQYVLRKAGRSILMQSHVLSNLVPKLVGEAQTFNNKTSTLRCLLREQARTGPINVKVGIIVECSVPIKCAVRNILEK